MNFKLIQEDRKCFADKNESGTQVFGVYTGGQVADGLGRVVYPVSQLDRWGWAFAPGTGHDRVQLCCCVEGPDGTRTRWHVGTDLQQHYAYETPVDYDDYELCAKHLRLWFDLLGLEPELSSATLKDDNFYSFTATFVRHYSRTNMFEFPVEFKMGRGLFGNLIPNKMPSNELPNTLPRAKLRYYAKPEQIFGCICQEAVDALDMPVAEWCREFFESEDSHAGHVAHAECLDKYAQLHRLIGAEKIHELAKLSRSL